MNGAPKKRRSVSVDLSPADIGSYSSASRGFEEPSGSIVQNMGWLTVAGAIAGMLVVPIGAWQLWVAIATRRDAKRVGGVNDVVTRPEGTIEGQVRTGTPEALTSNGGQRNTRVRNTRAWLRGHRTAVCYVYEQGKSSRYEDSNPDRIDSTLAGAIDGLAAGIKRMSSAIVGQGPPSAALRDVDYVRERLDAVRSAAYEAGPSVSVGEVSRICENLGQHLERLVMSASESAQARRALNDLLQDLDQLRCACTDEPDD